MTHEAESLMEQAFRLERKGDRDAAIAIYDEVAKGDSEHAAYAKNCAERLHEYESLAGPPEPQLDGLAWKHNNLLITFDSTTRPEPCAITNTTEDECDRSRV